MASRLRRPSIKRTKPLSKVLKAIYIIKSKGNVLCDLILGLVSVMFCCCGINSLLILLISDFYLFSNSWMTLWPACSTWRSPIAPPFQDRGWLETRAQCKDWPAFFGYQVLTIWLWLELFQKPSWLPKTFVTSKNVSNLNTLLSQKDQIQK